eukprot:1159988-Pelagomonas_calceolata.AAC.1
MPPPQPAVPPNLLSIPAGAAAPVGPHPVFSWGGCYVLQWHCFLPPAYAACPAAGPAAAGGGACRTACALGVTPTVPDRNLPLDAVQHARHRVGLGGPWCCWCIWVRQRKG